MPTPDGLTLFGPAVCLVAAACIWWARRRGDRLPVPADPDVRPVTSPYAYLSLALFAGVWFAAGMSIQVFPSP